VQSFDSAETFLSRCDLHQTACLLADIRLEGMNGLELQKRLAERQSPLPMAFITGHGDVSMAVEAMKKGALDFIQKPFDEIALIQTVERLLAAATGSFARQRQSAGREALLAALTHRETQVLECIVAGRLNKQIADDLSISVKTVEAHRANLMKKLGTSNIADLFRLVLDSES
jgi:FixJ family two-component response regulator